MLPYMADQPPKASKVCEVACAHAIPPGMWQWLFSGTRCLTLSMILQTLPGVCINLQHHLPGSVVNCGARCHTVNRGRPCPC
jgi:hypothetical protein